MAESFLVQSWQVMSKLAKSFCKKVGILFGLLPTFLNGVKTKLSTLLTEIE